MARTKISLAGYVGALEKKVENLQKAVKTIENNRVAKAKKTAAKALAGKLLTEIVEWANRMQELTSEVEKAKSQETNNVISAASDHSASDGDESEDELERSPNPLAPDPADD